MRLPDRRATFDYELLQAGDEVLVLASVIHPSRPLMIEGEEVMGAGYRCIWFLYKDQPWDIGRVYRPDGSWTGMYVDVLKPVRWQGNDPATLETIVDLFLDLWITPASRTFLLDEDELAEALATGGITPEDAEEAERVARDLQREVALAGFPPRAVWEWRE